MMDRRRLLVVAAVAVVAAVVIVRASARSAPPADPSSPEAAVEPVTAADEPGEVDVEATSTTVPSTTSSTSAAVETGPSVGQLGEAQAAEAVEAGEGAVAPADQWRALAASDAPREDLFRLMRDPASSDLPPAVAAQASKVGAAFTVADASGEGRGAFPGWWGDRPPEPVASNVRVLAAGAASYGRRVQVVVVWDGTEPDGSPLGEQTSTVLLEPTRSGFVPLHPGDVG